jgi:pimeloyl-ACP methyl ester carboxylesterase
MTEARIDQQWIGTPGPRALVFLHEGLGSIAQWRDTPAELARLTGLPALVYSRQGYGHSSPVAVPRPLTYMHDEATKIPHVDDPILVGHSDGASIAIIAAGEGLVKPRALVLIAPHVFVEELSVASIARAADAYRTGDLRAKLARHHADADGVFWGWNRAWLDPGFRSWNLEGYLPRITAPALVVQGERDEYGTRAQVDAIGRRLAGPVEVAMIPGAGHAPFRDAPAIVHARVAGFVARVLT